MADRADRGLRLCRERAGSFILVFALILPLLLLVTPGAATVYTYDGSDNATSIQDLINATVNGDSIYLAGGRYYGDLQINRSIVLGALDTGNPPEIVSPDSADAGIALLSDGITINGVIVSGGADTGILVKSGNNQIRGVTVRDLGRGIDLRSAQSTIVSGNTIVNNSIGIVVGRGSRSNTLYLNYFNNTRDAECQSADNMWSSGRQVFKYAGNEYTGQVGNFWAGYTGTDENGDGIGDTAYIIQEETAGDVPADIQGTAAQGQPGPGSLSVISDRAPLVSLPSAYTLVSVAGMHNISPVDDGGFLRQPDITGLQQQGIPQQKYQPVSSMPLPTDVPDPSVQRNPFILFLVQYWWIIPVALVISAAAGIWFGRRWWLRKQPAAESSPAAGSSPNVTVVRKTLPPPEPDGGAGHLHYAAHLPPALGKRYPDAEYIAEGGVSRVFKAWDSKEGRDVAVKIPIRFDEVTGTQFTKELHVWEGLHHKNIVGIYAANIFPVPYIEMEYVPSSLLAQKFPLAPGTAVAIIRGVAEGLRYAHGQGIVHRDIKPANIMIAEDGTPKISDWGLSKAEGTKQSGIIGFSLEYAAPEQLAPNLYGEPGPATDIYQLGVLFYEMLAGHVPFSGGGMGEITHAILHDPPQRFEPAGPNAALIGEIIGKCLEKRPQDRYGSVSQFLDDLEKVRT
jgi:parallel beta-helix repeat protein